MEDKHADKFTDRRADDATSCNQDEAGVNTDIEWCVSGHGTVLHEEVCPRRDI
jgi:hypothetical protein